MPKEDVEVRIGDHGHSVTIEGKVTSRRGGPASASMPENGNAGEASAPAGKQLVLIHRLTDVLILQ